VITSNCGSDGVKVAVDHNYEFIDHASGERLDRLRIPIPQTAVHGMSIDGLDAPIASIKISMPRLSKSRGQKQSAAVDVIDQAKLMADEIMEETDMLHWDWEGPLGQDQVSPKDPLEFMFNMDDSDWTCEVERQQKLGQAIKTLAHAAMDVISAEPTLLEASVPVKVFGDIHGQFRDMLLLLGDFGFPEEDGPTFIFNGDWVDRGKHQLEVICLIFALKLAFPSEVKLVRGNHEDPMQGMHMGPAGFPAHCIARLGPQVGHEVWNAIATVFDWLPMACLVSDRILVLHGGIGDGEWDLSYLVATKRPLNHDMLADDEILYNVLWSDPIPEDEADSYGVHDSPRDNHGHLVKAFGADVTAAFCERNKLEMVVRSHEAKMNGCGYDVMHDEHLMRVFSARDYEANSNDGAVLSIDRRAELGVGDGGLGGLWLAARLVVRAQVLKSLTKKRRKVSHAVLDARRLAK